MPRPRQFWNRKGSDYDFTKIDGVQARLEKTETPSQQAGAHSPRRERPATTGKGIRFASLADQFLEHSQHVNEPVCFW